MAMRVSKVAKNIYLIDVETGGIRNFIASYVLKGEKAAIVETGPTSSILNLIESLKELNMKFEDVEYVAVSHIHLDHGGGVGTLLKRLPNAKVVVHPRGAPHLANPEKLWEQSKEVLGGITKVYGKPEPVPENRIIAAADGEIFDVGNNIKLKAIETTGHASHHMSYYETSSNSVFPGDAAGIYVKEIDVVVPTTPPPFRLDIALASLDKLIALKPKMLYYSHFGESPNAVARLQQYAQQLRQWAEIARQSIAKGEDQQSVAKRILENDAAVRKAVEYIKAHPVLKETVLYHSVQGVMEFVEK